MKKMRRAMALCLMLSVTFSMIACNGKKEGTKWGTFVVAPKEVTSKKWSRYNPITEESEVISFGEDHSYMYYCECGEPVGDSDIYDTYSYDEETQTIHLFSAGEEAEKQIIKVCEISEKRLLLEIEGKMTEFKSDEE